MPVGSWTVRRLDDNDNEFVVQSDLTDEKARELVQEYGARGHKQAYWATYDPKPE